MYGQTNDIGTEVTSEPLEFQERIKMETKYLTQQIIEPHNIQNCLTSGFNSRQKWRLVFFSESLH